MRITNLLAKSDGTTLEKHTQDVVNAARQIEKALCAAPILEKAAFYHDLGKSAVFFQKRMYGLSPNEWYRHELFSLLICLSFKDGSALSFSEMAAIATHHKNINHDDLAQWMETDAASDLDVLVEEQLKPVWKHTEFLFGPLPSTLKTKEVSNFLKRLLDTAQKCTVWTEDGELLFRHRGALVAADHLASSGIGLTIAGDNITPQAIEEYSKKHIKAPWSNMQKVAQNKTGSALLTAPTGAGKTEAALLWAMHNRNAGERLFYVLPYQVSINAMAERLNKVFPAEGKTEAPLHENDTITILHSNTDLAYLQDCMNEQDDIKRANDIAKRKRDAARKIYSPIKVTTVYQLLDIFFGRKFFEVGLLELTNSLVVFDEIHAYDGHTMGLTLVLLDCLRRLGARVFIMTATLPQSLKEELKNASGISPASEISLQNDDTLITEVRREITAHNVNIESMVEEIADAVGRGKKVVVVCNTVKKAMCLYNELCHLDPHLVHSRFMLRDRVKREKKEEIESHKFVIATQVIEVSLDVSFDVMFTELAPADSLLQRFGRVNRHGAVDKANLGQCHVACAPDSGSKIIYDEEILEATKQFLESEIANKNKDNNNTLDFPTSCQWIEAVYPEGLSTSESERKANAQRLFQCCVDELRPMLDSVAVDLEANLFDSVQVVPVEHIEEWYQYKQEGRHIEAKGLIVNIHRGVWKAAIAKAPDACYELPYGKNQKLIVACFPYNGVTDGLDLEADPLPQKRPVSSYIFTSDDS